MGTLDHRISPESIRQLHESIKPVVSRRDKFSTLHELRDVALHDDLPRESREVDVGEEIRLRRLKECMLSHRSSLISPYVLLSFLAFHEQEVIRYVSHYRLHPETTGDAELGYTTKLTLYRRA